MSTDYGGEKAFFGLSLNSMKNWICLSKIFYSSGEYSRPIITPVGFWSTLLCPIAILISFGESVVRRWKENSSSTDYETEFFKNY